MIDDADRVTEASERVMDQWLQRRAAKTARGNTTASAGRACADCERPIPFARLAAMPSTTRCLPCQARAEARDRG